MSPLSLLRVWMLKNRDTSGATGLLIGVIDAGMVCILDQRLGSVEKPAGYLAVLWAVLLGEGAGRIIGAG